MTYLLVFLGGGIGSALRYALNALAARTLGSHFPWGTFLINVSGSVLMGLIAGYLTSRGDGAAASSAQPWRLFLMTGVLGGYTTFSAFSLDAALLYERGSPGLAAAYVAGSVALAIAGLFAGLAMVRALG
jgi:CrcB protein